MSATEPGMFSSFVWSEEMVTTNNTMPEKAAKELGGQ